MEVRHLGRWYSICGLQFTELDGEVVCRELGLGFIGKTFSSWEYGIIYFCSLECNSEACWNENKIPISGMLYAVLKLLLANRALFQTRF